MTVAEALRAATRVLADAGVPDAAGDARALMAHALRVARDRVTLMAPDELPRMAAVRFDAALSARAARRPVSRIVGYRDFHGHRLAITQDVLDPRPETETLVDAALERPFARVIDLGTGSGAILLSLLAAAPGATGVGTDKSHAALDVARLNARTLGLEARAEFLHADWWSGVSGQFDLVVSNPPYIAGNEIVDLAPEVAEHDPWMALSPGGDGMGAYRALLAGLSAHIAPGGRALFEIGAGQRAALSQLAERAGFGPPAFLSDLDGRDRVAVLTHEGAVARK
ncbi:MAG: peptide chain release factor N(5)-glutamine methyltransferase [Pseudomonadota bacterium]